MAREGESYSADNLSGLRYFNRLILSIIHVLVISTVVAWARLISVLHATAAQHWVHRDNVLSVPVMSHRMNVLRARSPPHPARVHSRLPSAALPPRHLGLAPCSAVLVARRPATRCHDTTSTIFCGFPPPGQTRNATASDSWYQLTNPAPPVKHTPHH